MSNLKKICLACGIAMLWIFIFNIASFASTKGKVTTETLRLRKEASSSAEILELISQDEEIEILEETGDWYKVTYKDITGYVSKQYVKAEGSIQETQPPVQDEENPNKEEEPTQEQPAIPEITEPSLPMEKTIITDIDVNITPLVYSSTLATLKKDTKVTLTQVINGWAYVVSENTAGWIRLDSLEGTSNANDQTEPQSTNADNFPDQEPENTVAYVNSDDVNFREEANTSSEVLKSLSKNKEVKILQAGDEWTKIEVDGEIGYIATRLLSDKKVEITARNQENQRPTQQPSESEETSDTTVTEPEDNSENVGAKGAQLVAMSKQYLGYAYVYGGNSPSKGFDCSGFTYYLYNQFGYTLNRTATGQSSNGRKVAKSELQLGDLIIFNGEANSSIGHVGIYIGSNNFIHASNPSDGVKITSLSNSYYTARYVTARRILE